MTIKRIEEYLYTTKKSFQDILLNEKSKVEKSMYSMLSFI